MEIWRNYIRNHKAICWLLVSALILQLLIQLQFHLHHEDPQQIITDQAHVVDYHLFTDSHSEGHPDHENTHEFKSTPDVIVKKSIDTNFSIVLAGCLLLLITLNLLVRKQQWLLPKNHLTHNLYYGLAPPSRGPPAI
jgi:hypothetical protein